MNSVSSLCFQSPFCGLFLWASSFFYRVPLNISCRAGLVVTYSFSFCLSWKVFISLSILNESLSGQSILGCMFFSFRTLNISCQPFLACQVPVEKTVVNLIFLSIKVRDFLSLAALRIFSLSLEFASFTIKCQAVERFLLILGGDLSISWI